MTPGEIEALTIAMEQAASRLEIDLMKDIVRRIKANSDMTASAEYQINRLRQMGLADDYIKKQIQIYLKASEEEINRIFGEVLENEYAKLNAGYSAAGVEQTPFGNHVALQAMVQAAKKQTEDTFVNISQTLGFSVIEQGKQVFNPIAEYFQKALDNAILGIVSGAFDYNTALKKVVQEMTRSGVRTVDYASGRKYRIESASRAALMTGFSQVTRYMYEQTARELGTDDYEVSYHIGARPTHQWWQGRVYSYQELINTCGLGTVTGLCGINCYHWYNPFIRGISVRNYTDEQLDRMIAEENRLKYYAGKGYTTYDALQKQRSMELLMRKQRQDIALLKEGDGGELDILAVQTRYRTTMQEYVKFSEAVNLPQQKERIYMDGLGRVSTGPKNYVKSVAKPNKDGTIKAKKYGLVIDDKQFGKKVGKHAKDFGLTPGDPENREKMKEIINDIIDDPDEIVKGMWRGQGAVLPSGAKADGPVDFVIKGNDVVVARDGKFVTILKDGVDNARVKKARGKV